MPKRSPGSPSMPADRRVVVGLDGTRSYGIGLALVLQGAGLTVVEIERPRRGSGGGASRTRSMPTWLRCTRCAWPLTGCPHRALTVTVRRHGIRGRGLPGCSRRGRHAAPAAHGSRRESTGLRPGSGMRSLGATRRPSICIAIPSNPCTDTDATVMMGQQEGCRHASF
jgi:hypothetical protein